MITAATWVPRGFAAPFPTKATFDEAEFERIAELAKFQLDDAEEDLKEAQDAQDEASDEETKPKTGNSAEKAGSKKPATESSEWVPHHRCRGLHGRLGR